MRFLERFADPLLLGKVIDPQAFITAMQGQGLEAVVGVGTDESVTAVTQGLSGEFDRVESALGRRIQKMILGQTLTSEVGDTGSYAAAQVHNEVRQDKRLADIRLINHSVQAICNAIWTLNAFPDKAPTFILQDDSGLEIARAERDSKLASSGILTFTEKYLLDRYDFEPGDFSLAMATITPADESVAFDDESGVMLAANRPQRFTQDQAAVESLIESAVGDVQSPVSIDKIRRACLAATGPDDLMERLIKLYEGNDPKEWDALLEKALFTADVLGYVNADKKIGGG